MIKNSNNVEFLCFSEEYVELKIINRQTIARVFDCIDLLWSLFMYNAIRELKYA